MEADLAWGNNFSEAYVMRIASWSGDGDDEHVLQRGDVGIWASADDVLSSAAAGASVHHRNRAPLRDKPPPLHQKRDQRALTYPHCKSAVAYFTGLLGAAGCSADCAISSATAPLSPHARPHASSDT